MTMARAWVRLPDGAVENMRVRDMPPGAELVPGEQMFPIYGCSLSPEILFAGLTPPPAPELN